MPRWSPFSLSQRLDDLARLTWLFHGMDSDSATHLLAGFEIVELETGDHLDIASRGPDSAFLTILSGNGSYESVAGSRAIELGDTFGESALGRALASPAERDAAAPNEPTHRIIAAMPMRIAALRRSRFDQLGEANPTLALRFLRAKIDLDSASADLTSRHVAPNTSTETNHRVGDGLPKEIGGVLVVGARAGHRIVGLSAPLPAIPIVPLTVHDWEGRDVYRRSASLLFLEAARRLGLPPLRCGPSWTSGRIIDHFRGEDPKGTARALTQSISELCAARVPFVETTVLIDDAIGVFKASDDLDSRLLLEGRTERFARLVRCGSTVLVSPGPFLPDAGYLSNIEVVPRREGLLLDFGERVRKELPQRPQSTMAMELKAPRYGSSMTLEAQSWLELLGITSVGTFNSACVSGEVRELIHVAEGFHEKGIAKIADDVRACGGVHVIAVAGPSSSGKTTFVRRLRIQLEVLGIHPLGLSLDDYYRDRATTALDADGQPDFEALEALDLTLLHHHLARLVSGEAVRTARYDFLTGESHPEGGPLIELGPRSVLLMEGIHALNPSLLTSIETQSVVKVFIHPATALPFDALTSFEPADVRLLRRIVRDRRQRGADAELSLKQWGSVRTGERMNIYPSFVEADHVFDTALVYEVSVLKVFAERYLREVPRSSPYYGAALRLRELINPFVPIHPDHVPGTSILREFIGGSELDY